MNYNFDQAVVLRPDGSRQTLTAEDFFNIQLEERVDLLCQGKVNFTLRGEIVSPLKAIRKDG